MTIDLQSLPAPDVVQTVDFEGNLARAKSLLLEAMPELASVIDLESEPTVKLLQVLAYFKITVDARINDAAKSNLLAFAEGGDLEQLAAFYGVTKQNDEVDDRLRLRVQLRIAALAGNGTIEHYRSVILDACPDVVDVAVLHPLVGGVECAVWLTAGAVVETALEAVREAVLGDVSRILGVPITVCLARPRPVDFSAVIYRESTAPISVVTYLQDTIGDTIKLHSKLGRDVSFSWLMSLLHREGVSRVDLKFSGLILADDEYSVPGQFSIVDGGVQW